MRDQKQSMFTHRKNHRAMLKGHSICATAYSGPASIDELIFAIEKWPRSTNTRLGPLEKTAGRLRPGGVA
jgi:hypothetical protein